VDCTGSTLGGRFTQISVEEVTCGIRRTGFITRDTLFGISPSAKANIDVSTVWKDKGYYPC